MKKLFFLPFVIFVLFAICPKTFASDEVRIKNHAFAVITDKASTKSRDRIAVFIRNEDCMVNYRAIYGEAVLGEGTMEVSVANTPTIQLGESELTFRCLPLKELLVDVR